MKLEKLGVWGNILGFLMLPFLLLFGLLIIPVYWTFLLFNGIKNIFLGEE